MSGRSKRVKSASAARIRSSGVSCGDSAEIRTPAGPGARESASEIRFPVEASTFECGSFASRCSVRLINEVVSKFDSVKRDLVQSTGFECILKFPVFKQFNRKFALWLMSCVNEHKSSLVIGDHIAIRFTKADVGYVLGTPASGKAVLDVRFSNRDAKDKVLNEMLPPEFKEFRSIKLVQEVIERQYDYPMSKSEADKFRVAFVVFVASNLLAPSAKYDYACVDYWNAIQDPEDIGSYDWSEYVISRLLEGVIKLKQDIASNIKFPNITGCSIFLQVLYLDSIHLEGLSRPQISLPRIVDFPFDKLRPMIQADFNYLRYLKGQDDLPVVHLRDPSTCIYAWAYDVIHENDVSKEGCWFSIWEAAVAMSHLLKIPLEAAGPIFCALADFQEQVNSGLFVTGIHALKFVTVLVSIMLPYSRGFSYLPSYGTEPAYHGVDVVESTIINGLSRMSFPIRNRSSRSKKTSISGIHVSNQICKGKDKACTSYSAGFSGANGAIKLIEIAGADDVVQRSMDSVIASIDDIPHKLNVPLRVVSAMSEFYALIRNRKSAMDFDLNVGSVDDMLSAQASSSLVIGTSDYLGFPWVNGYSWCSCAARTHVVFEYLRSIESNESFVVFHTRPKHIQVSLRALVSQILGKCEIEVDMFDALIRTVTQQDDVMYCSFGSIRWRFFFESDLMAQILTGSFDLVDCNLWKKLQISDVPFDFSRSKLVFFPALLHCSWVCFTWSLEDNTIYVFEPSFLPPVPDFRVQAIERASFLLKLALHTLSRSVFNGVDVDALSAEIRIITLSRSVVNRLNRSGVLCAYFCRCFDGHEIIAHCQVVDDVAVRLLKDLVSLHHNSGSFPPPLLDML